MPQEKLNGLIQARLMSKYHLTIKQLEDKLDTIREQYIANRSEDLKKRGIDLSEEIGRIKRIGELNWMRERLASYKRDPFEQVFGT